MLIRKLGIDLGTTNTLVFVPGRGVIINEPSVVAVGVDDEKILAVGNVAKEMLGRTPDSIIATKPLKDGVIADYRMTQAMLSYFINKAFGRFRLFRPDVMISVPAGITSTERRAVIEAALQAGAKAAYVVKEPILAAIGANLPINESSGNLIVNIGGGTIEIAVISLGGIVAWNSKRVGGNKLDAAIIEYLRKKHSLAIGEQTAEEIKMAIGSAMTSKKEEFTEIRGRDLVDGLPKTIKVSNNSITEAMKDELDEMVKAVKDVLQKTPPELAADIIEKGMVISGGGALLKNIDSLLTKETGVAAYIASEPLLCVAKGTGLALDNLEIYKRSIMSKK
ncbi:rod shape-determining protein [Candidatus Parcubacteria bacterium]|nr:MAG: rod shape-determining protein [Candidatus Parcubacteria bacterium]